MEYYDRNIVKIATMLSRVCQTVRDISDKCERMKNTITRKQYEPEHTFSIYCQCYDCARWKKKHPKKWKKLYIEEQKQRRANRLGLNESRVEKFLGRVFGQSTK